MRYRMSRKEDTEMGPREKQCRNVQPKEHCNLKSLGICSLPSVRRPTSGTPVSNATEQLQACVLRMRMACIATYPPAVRVLTNSKSPQVAAVVRGSVNHDFSLAARPSRVEGYALAVDFVDLGIQKGFCRRDVGAKFAMHRGSVGHSLGVSPDDRGFVNQGIDGVDGGGPRHWKRV